MSKIQLCKTNSNDYTNITNVNNDNISISFGFDVVTRKYYLSSNLGSIIGVPNKKYNGYVTIMKTKQDIGGAAPGNDHLPKGIINDNNIGNLTESLNLSEYVYRPGSRYYDFDTGRYGFTSESDCLISKLSADIKGYITSEGDNHYISTGPTDASE